MLTPTLLTALKVAVPVGTVASMGGAIYFASEYLPRKSTSSDVVYLLVKGKTNSTESTQALSTTTENSKTTKNYLCQSTIGTKTIEDKNCSLFKLNGKTTDSIDINENMFSDTLLASETGSVTTTSHHILKVSKSFYASLKKATTAQDITLVNKSTKEDKTKHLGIVTSLTNLDLNPKSPLAEQSTNLFLARIKTKGTTTSTSTTDPLSCKLSADKSIPCKIYKLGTSDKEKTNEHTNTTLSNLTPITASPSTDLAANNYIVVELTDTLVKASDLHNKVLTINKTPAANTASVEADKVADVIFDQQLIGKVNTTTPTSSTIFPITPNFKSFAVKKSTSGSTDFTDIQTTSNKNYLCKFTTSSNDNYDNSCLLKVFPTITNQKIHTYESIQAPSLSLSGVQTNISSTDHFVLTLDSNKLYNLKPDWTKTEPANIVVVENTTTPSKSYTLTLLHELTTTKAKGRTDLALVKYKSKVEITNETTPAPAANKCFFTNDDKEGFDCTFKKANTTPEIASPYTGVGFATASASAFADNEHYALLTTGTTRQIKDFDSKFVHCHLTESGKTNKYTFDIIAAMGGDVTDNKIAYFLEAPRTITA